MNNREPDILPDSMSPLRRAVAALVAPLLPLLAAASLAGCGGSVTTMTQPILKEKEIRATGATLTPLDALNSPLDDFSVTMPLDTTVLFFSSARGGAQGPHSIFSSRLVGGSWIPPSLAIEINNTHSNGTVSITPGGESIYFAGHEYGFGDADLYRADIGPRGDIPTEKTPWSVPVNLGLKINGTLWESEPCISSDGSILYFSSDRAGGFGNRDIWVSRRKADGSWDKPINAGEDINTPFDEVTPWLSPDNQTLFFSSNGHPGLGGFDIFSVTSVAGETIVENLGTPANSSANEICFSLSAGGKQAFLASNRSGGKGGYDIYRISPVPVLIDPIMTVHGKVLGKNGKPLVATVEVTDLISTQSLGSFATDPETGLYTLVLPRGYNYALTAQTPGYLFSSQQLLVPKDLERDDTRSIDFTLQPINGVVRLLVFFKANESNLQKESTADLDRLVTFMQANPAIRIEIAGHTDNSGDPKAATALSTERAQAVKSYLVGNRIQTDRIKVTGYGATQPIASNDSEEGRAINRRVEMRVLEVK